VRKFPFLEFSPYVKRGYVVREDHEWGRDLGVKERKAIRLPLFKGNDYWFCMGTDVDKARVDIHVYDNKGRLAEVEAWQNGHFAAAQLSLAIHSSPRFAFFAGDTRIYPRIGLRRVPDAGSA